MGQVPGVLPPVDDQQRWARKVAAEQRRKALRDRAIDHLGGKCRICGYDECPAAMDFHHLDPYAKDFAISAGSTSWQRIEPELKKCVLLCANCHREVHDGRHSLYLPDQDSMRSQLDYDDPEADVEEVPPLSSPGGQ